MPAANHLLMAGGVAIGCQWVGAATAGIQHGARQEGEMRRAGNA